MVVVEVGDTVVVVVVEVGAVVEVVVGDTVVVVVATCGAVVVVELDVVPVGGAGSVNVQVASAQS